MLKIEIIRWSRTLLCVPFALLAACGALNKDDPTFHVRAVNLISDSPTVKVYFGDTSIATAGYSSVTTWAAAEAGSHNVNLKVIHPGNLNDDDDDDAEETAIGAAFSQSFEENKDYTLFTYGTLSDPHVFVIDATGQRDSVDDNLLFYRIANVSPKAQAVDVYVTAPEASITTPQLVATLSPGQTTDQIKLTIEAEEDAIDEDATRYVDLTFEVRAAGTSTVLYTSSAITASEKSRLMMAITDNDGLGPSAVRLLDLGSDATATAFADPDDTAAVRFVHMSKASPALDVFSGSFANAMAQNVAFRGQSAYATTANGEVGLIATPTGVTTTFAFLEEYTASAEQSYSAYAIGTSSDVDAYVFNDDRRSVPTQMKFRFLDAAASLEDEVLDIYVVAAGGTIQFPDDNSSTTDTVPQFSSASYLSATSYLTLEGGSYDVYFAVADSEKILLGPVNINIANGTNQTLVLTDNESDQLELIPVNDTP